jgi:hypothetical protein
LFTTSPDPRSVYLPSGAGSNASRSGGSENSSSDPTGADGHCALVRFNDHPVSLLPANQLFALIDVREPNQDVLAHHFVPFHWVSIAPGSNAITQA